MPSSCGCLCSHLTSMIHLFKPFNMLQQSDEFTNVNNDVDENPQSSSVQAANTDANKGKWTPNGIRLLITERLERDSIFTHPTCRKQKIWDEIGMIIKEKIGLDTTGIDCNNKYRNLLQTYRANKSRSLRIGEEAVTWEYYKLFDDVLGTRESTVQSILGSAMKEPGSSSKKRKTKEMKLEHYLLLKQKRSEEMFEIKHQLKLKQIDVINNVAEVLRSIAQNKGPS